MDDKQIENLIKTLRNAYSDEGPQAAYALGEMGAVSAIPYLIEALKDEYEELRASAAYALGKMGDTYAVPSLIAAMRDKHYGVRQNAACALNMIGDADLLPRKILAETRFTARERLSHLETLRHVRFNDILTTLRYKFPDTRTLCQTVLEEDDPNACVGAQEVLNLLDGETLLRAS